MPSIDHELQALQQSIATLLLLQDLDDGQLLEVTRLLANLNAVPLVQPQAQPQQIQLPPLVIPPPPTTQPPRTPPARPHADRWHTPISVEQIIRGRMRYVKWFSDFQIAYMYIEGTIANDDNDWIIADFHETADMMDEYWLHGEEGLPVARCDETETIYIAYYEPEEAEAYHAAVQQGRHRNPVITPTPPTLQPRQRMP